MSLDTVEISVFLRRRRARAAKLLCLPATLKQSGTTRQVVGVPGLSVNLFCGIRSHQPGVNLADDVMLSVTGVLSFVVARAIYC
jgi:hypothetical protein